MIEEYKKNGFVVLRDAVSPHIPMREFYDAAASRLEGAMVTQGLPALRREASAMARMAMIHDAFLSPKIQGACQDLGIRIPTFTTAPASHIMGFDPDWRGVGPHQDWNSIQTSLNAIVVWMPFGDIRGDNFPLEIAPGSHLLGLLPAKIGDHYSEVDASGMEFDAITLRAGDVVLFSVFTVHRTRTPGRGFRLAFSHRYEDAADPWFEEHNYAAQSRVIAREVKFAPTAEQVQEVFR